MILGGGRVGRETGWALQKRKIDYRIIECLPERIHDHDKYILGDAADPKVLEQAGIMQSPAAVIIPHDDDMTIYLTILCRKFRPDMQIIRRATLDRNVSRLHRAGADIVMSYASMGANAVFNLLERGDIVMVAEGLNVLRVDIPKSLVGKTISESAIRQETGLTVVALESSGMAIVRNIRNSLPNLTVFTSSSTVPNKMEALGNTAGRKLLEKRLLPS